MLNYFKINSDEPLQSRLFKSSLIACAIAATILLVHDIIFAFLLVDLIVELIGIFISLLFFYLAKNEKMNKGLPFLFILIVVILLDFSWFGNKSLGVAHILYFLAVLVIGTIIINDSLRKVFLGLFSLNIIAILVIEAVDPRFNSIHSHFSPESVIVKAVYLVISYSIITWAVIFLKHHYNLTFNLSKQQNEALKIKNDEIAQQKKLIESQNQNLELLVAKRTAHIEKQNEQLLDYAFFNSHKVRAPLANLLAILEIIQHSDINADELLHLQQLLVIETGRLDTEIRTVQDSIHQILTLDSN